MKFMIYDHNNSLNQSFWKVHFCQVWWVVFILFFSSVEFIDLYFIHQSQRGWGDNFHLLMMSHSSTDATMGWNNFYLEPTLYKRHPLPNFLFFKIFQKKNSVAPQCTRLLAMNNSCKERDLKEHRYLNNWGINLCLEKGQV